VEACNSQGTAVRGEILDFGFWILERVVERAWCLGWVRVKGEGWWVVGAEIVAVVVEEQNWLETLLGRRSNVT
jgi:hypothetical protein